MSNLALGEFSVFGQQLREQVELSGRTRMETKQQLGVQRGRILEARLSLRRSNGQALLLSTSSLACSRMQVTLAHR